MTPQTDPNLGFNPEELEVLGDETVDNADDLDFEVEKLTAVNRYVSLKTVAYKTVDTFAGITKRRLWLRNAPAPETDGNEIRAPFDHPDFYRLVEQQLAHILFRTDAKAKRLFVEEYTQKIGQVAKLRNVTLDLRLLGSSLTTIVTLLERRRVRSLWAELYPGSYQLMRESDRSMLKFLAPVAHASILNLMTCVEVLGKEVVKGDLDRYRPYMEEAFLKVERRGPVASLAVSKWLILQLVNEIIRETKNLPPPPPPEDSEDTKTQSEGASSAQEVSEDGEGDPGEQDEAEDGEGEGDEGDQSPGQWNPEPPEATPDERGQALGALANKLGGPPDQARDPVTESPHQQGRTSSKSMALSAAGLSAPVNNPQQFEQQLQQSEEEMKELLKQTRAAMKQQFYEEDWLQKGAMAKVMFIDEPPNPPAQLAYEDQQTVQRLRALFHQVMGRRRAMLADSGTEVDLLSYIERKATGVAVPMFREETKGRGFRAHLLLDLSGSMQGLKMQQCERAARIIQRALKYPFVTIDIWGFSAHEPGEVKITRFDSKSDVQLSMALKGAGGYTPIHIATRVAVRKLTEGHEDKQLIILTDGKPVHQRRDGRYFSTRQLLLLLRNEVRAARKDGTNVTGILLGDHTRDPQLPMGTVQYDLEDRDLLFVFGNRHNWRKMMPNRIGHDLVQLVATSFLEFLKRR